MKAEGAKELMAQLMPVLRNHVITMRLSENQFATLQYLCYVMFLHGMQSRNGAIYCVPSEERIATFVDVHRVTISRTVSSLKSMKLLDVIQRRPVDGRWQTNLYKLSKLFWALFGFIIKRFRHYLNRVTGVLHIVTESHSKFSSNQKTSDFSYKLKDLPLENIISRMEKAHPELA